MLSISIYIVTESDGVVSVIFLSVHYMADRAYATSVYCR